MQIQNPDKRKDRYAMQQEVNEVQNKDIILNSEVRDSGGKLIFGDNELCSQFLRNYIDLPGMKDVTSADIEDVSEQFVPLFAEERNADRVKRVQLKKGQENEPPFFLVSLIEHKTQVEFNVCMQIFRYMIYIWEDYEKEMEKQHKGISRQMNFKYPPILPIVYYEGRKEWTAPMDFKSRVNKSDIFGEYIPDFKYYLVPIQKYSNEDLLSKEDEISLIMLINKMQQLEDVKEFRELPAAKINKILANTPKHIEDIIVRILMAFQLKANVPIAEAEENVGKVREKNVARLFENADLGDVQARRREFAELNEKLGKLSFEKEQIEKQLEATEKQIEEAEKQKEEAEKQKEEIEKRAEESVIAIFIETLRECGLQRESVLERLQEKFEMKKENAEEKLELYYR